MYREKKMAKLLNEFQDMFTSGELGFRNIMALEPEIGISMVATLRRGLGALP
jgi:hypothetical protein